MTKLISRSPAERASARLCAKSVALLRLIEAGQGCVEDALTGLMAGCAAFEERSKA